MGAEQPRRQPSPIRDAPGLAPAERLLLCAAHSWLSAADAGTRRALGATLAELTSPRVAALFSAWMLEIDASSVRPLRPACGRCAGFGPDLQRLVAACGVAPVAFEAGRMLLEPLVLDTGSTMVLARSLNSALAACGWRLPVRMVAPPGYADPGQTRH